MGIEKKMEYDQFWNGNIYRSRASMFSIGKKKGRNEQRMPVRYKKEEEKKSDTKEIFSISKGNGIHDINYFLKKKKKATAKKKFNVDFLSA